MADMDTTRIEELLTKLEDADPAEAPDVADELTATLAEALDEPASNEAEPAVEPTTDTTGGTL